MAVQILMPALSPTMTEGTLAKWNVKEGDSVASGDVMAEIETDKATMEFEAVDEGVIAKILVPEGTEGVAVNTPIAILAEEGEDAADAVKEAGDNAPAAKAAPTAPPAASPEPAKAEAPAAAPVQSAAPAPAASGDRVFASPLARRMASTEGLDLKAISGTGPHGRVVKSDIEKALAAGTGKAAAPAAAPAAASAPGAVPAKPAAAGAPPVLSADDPIFKMLPEAEAIPHSNMRKTIAKRLTESARDIPHFSLQVDVEIDKLLAMRKQLNERDGADYKISVNDFVIKATALALSRVPDCNVAYTDSAILKFKKVDMAMAVAVDGGLITPIIKDCASKGLATISQEAKSLAAKARDGKLAPEEYQGGTFTISNLGMFGVKSFNSIINVPQGGILSVGAGEQRPVVKDGALAVATVMSLSLAVDHRCIDGATGAALVKELKALIEDPIALML
ncbi:pyruvate dehydrogenase complex dihydrolipoamide acetyltransferase [Rhodospirillaceae bacterium KN72]|uniref:Acetyltransferase component of pyruvate dehydrogenase complex n=1 Tax=Pacificispira spongiicola TaxID=2729598 RepID=A0A7Y0E2J4_9PROT|nr:pyruvate dehydrogenase complex dihydrolipoamide acetyltransferase [Pacificispira spongiicola]NMM46001.1 pyruvate dehydrogenase complex dihydrolipoamide acetyltransferase [Pacificispira spongiicola]